jgi:hypothetical protein
MEPGLVEKSIVAQLVKKFPVSSMEPEIRNHSYESLLLVPLLRHMNPINTLISYSFNIRFIIFVLSSNLCGVTESLSRVFVVFFSVFGRML